MKRVPIYRKKPSGRVFKIRRLGGAGKPCETVCAMTDPQKNYRWPWFVLAAVLLGIVLAVVWVGLAVKKVEQQRDFTPLPSTAPMR